MARSRYRSRDSPQLRGDVRSHDTKAAMATACNRCPSLCRSGRIWETFFECGQRLELALTAGLCSCSKSFGYVRDNGLAGIVGHSPEDDPIRSFRGVKRYGLTSCGAASAQAAAQAACASAPGTGSSRRSKHQRFRWRVEVEPDHVPELLLEFRIVRELEGLGDVRLQLVLTQMGCTVL